MARDFRLPVESSTGRTSKPCGPTRASTTWWAACCSDRRHGEPRRRRARVRRKCERRGRALRAGRDRDRFRFAQDGAGVFRPTAAPSRRRRWCWRRACGPPSSRGWAGQRRAVSREHVWVRPSLPREPTNAAPFLRDLDGYLYIRHYRGATSWAPSSERQAEATRRRAHWTASRSSVPTGIISRRCSPTRRQRLPELETIGSAISSRAGSFTPDANFQLASSRGARLFVAAGLNSQGIIFDRGLAWRSRVDRRGASHDGPR